MRLLTIFLFALGLSFGLVGRLQAVGKLYQATPNYNEEGKIWKWDCAGTCGPGYCCQVGPE